MKKTKGLVVLIVILLVLLSCLVLWLKPKNETIQKAALSGANIRDEINQLTSAEAVTTGLIKGKIPELAPSLQGTQINCSLTVDNNKNFVVDQNTKGCFEYYLTQFGELTLAQIDTQVRDYITHNLPEAAVLQAIDLWQRYLKYLEAEGRMQGSDPDPNDPAQLEKVLKNLAEIRKQYFNMKEIDALFGYDVVYDEYTVDRLKILDNKKLDSKTKARLLNERFAQLPANLQKNLQEMGKLENLRTLTKDIKSRNGSATELRQMREQLVGAQAADNLEVLDRNRAQWKSKVNSYLDQRQKVLNSNLSDVDKQKSIEALRQQSFSSEVERNRAISFENFRDQNVDIETLTQ